MSGIDTRQHSAIGILFGINFQSGAVQLAYHAPRDFVRGHLHHRFGRPPSVILTSTASVDNSAVTSVDLNLYTLLPDDFEDTDRALSDPQATDKAATRSINDVLPNSMQSPTLSVPCPYR